MHPLRLEAPPGPEMLRQSGARIEIASPPSPGEIGRVRRHAEPPVYALFDLATLPKAIAALRGAGLRSLTAVRGRLVPAMHSELFARIWLGDGLIALLRDDGVEMPARFRHPLLFAESWCGGARERLGAAFSRLPDPGAIDLADFARAGRREGAAAATLAGEEGSLDPAELESLIDEARSFAVRRFLLVDAGGESASAADVLLARGALGAWFGCADRAVPEAVVEAGVPVHLWFEIEDLAGTSAPAAPGPQACAHLPIGRPGQSPAVVDEQVARFRATGFTAIVPRFHVPVPATEEWEALRRAAPLRRDPLALLDGSAPVFAVPGFDLAPARDPMRRWTAWNRWPEASGGAPRAVAPYSLASLRDVLRGFARLSRSEPDRHGRELFDAVLRELDGGTIERIADYPFVAWKGESVLVRIDRAVQARLDSIRDCPEALLRAIRHTAVGGGKRIRPVLAATVALALGAPVDVAIAAALPLEWLHTASLVQDDLPCMDDDPVRRRAPAAHVRHGEALAILASDALVAMAFEDLAMLATNPVVGGERASRLVAATAAALGAGGTIGGQALDLQARESDVLDAAALIDIHRRKTAPLFRLAGTFGAVLTDASAAERARLEDALGDLGVAFQIADDLLDPSPALGRAGGSDARSGRPTFATAVPRQRALDLARRLAKPAAATSMLGELARFVVGRRLDAEHEQQDQPGEEVDA